MAELQDDIRAEVHAVLVERFPEMESDDIAVDNVMNIILQNRVKRGLWRNSVGAEIWVRDLVHGGNGLAVWIAEDRTALFGRKDLYVSQEALVNFGYEFIQDWED